MDLIRKRLRWFIKRGRMQERGLVGRIDRGGEKEGGGKGPIKGESIEGKES